MGFRFTLPEGTVTLKARAFQTDWTPSATVSVAYTLDGTPPTIVADVFPAAIGGWHSGPATVTFRCSDAVGIASCPGPLSVTAAGDTVASGTVSSFARRGPVVFG
jgi:hypothetical protein